MILFVFLLYHCAKRDASSCIIKGMNYLFLAIHKVVLYTISVKHGHISLQATKTNGTCLENLTIACEQQRHRPACTEVQADQCLCYSLIGKYNI